MAGLLLSFRSLAEPCLERTEMNIREFLDQIDFVRDDMGDAEVVIQIAGKHIAVELVERDMNGGPVVVVPKSRRTVS